MIVPLSENFDKMKKLSFAKNVKRNGTSNNHQFLTALDIHIDVSHRNFFELKLWSPSRWSKRMRQDSAFPMDANGRIRVPASGVYFVYAQVWDDAGLPQSNFTLGVILRQFLNNLHSSLRSTTWTSTT